MAAAEGEEGEGGPLPPVFGDPADSGEGTSCRVAEGSGILPGATAQAQSMLAPITDSRMRL